MFPAPSLGGMTGLINIPSADILSDGAFRIGYSVYAKEQAYELRDRADNEVIHVALGFLPRVEVMIRATLFPGVTQVEGVKIPNVDRMAAGKVLVLREGRGPAIAVGLDDPTGTRRFHSLYAVASKSFLTWDSGRGVRLTAGYGSTALNAKRHILDGLFGGADLRFAPFSGIVEYDTEKWNAGARVLVLGRFHVQAVLLDLEVFSGGISWSHSF